MHHIKRLMSPRTFHNLLYLPAAVVKIQTWVPFFIDYAGMGGSGRTYKLRNGVRLATHDVMDTATIGVIFLRQDYGIIPDNSVVIDIGANIGVFSVYAATTARNTVVYAYEPMPANFAMLVQNVRLNGLDGCIKAFPCGIAGAKEVRTLYLADVNVGHSIFPSEAAGHRAASAAECANGDCSANARVAINCLRLQDVFDENSIEKCHLLKMDCEGAEYESLYNTPEEYFERIDAIRMEYHGDLTEGQGEKTPQGLKRFLENKGYRVTRVVPEMNGRGMLWAQKS